MPIPAPVNTAQPHKIASLTAVTNPAFQTIVQKPTVKSFFSSEIGFKTTANLPRTEVLMAIMNAVSNAVSIVDRDLKSQQYKAVVQFGQIVWLESIDRAKSIEWRIIPVVRANPGGTNLVVGGIKAIVYQDFDMQQKDPARSFQFDLYPESGTLSSFWWDDKHEVLRGRSDRVSFDYSKHLGGDKSMVMVWDVKGGVVSSNVYDWANRGRAISGWTITNTPIYEDAPIYKTRSKFGR